MVGHLNCTVKAVYIKFLEAKSGYSADFSPNESHCFLSLLYYLTLYISLHSICLLNLVLLPCTNSIPKYRGLFT